MARRKTNSIRDLVDLIGEWYGLRIAIAIGNATYAKHLLRRRGQVDVDSEFDFDLCDEKERAGTISRARRRLRLLAPGIESAQDTLRERFRSLGVPAPSNLADGYQRDFSKVVEIHVNTLCERAAAWLCPGSGIGSSGAI